MSMISAQIDELRKWADQLSERENEFGVVVRALVAALRDAADTIWQLRDDLQRTHRLLDESEHDESRAWDRVRKAEAEADRLRELVVALYHIHFGTDEESWDAWEDFCPCGTCEERHGGDAPCAYTAKDLADECCEPITKEIVIDRMRELGVEVDG